MTTICVSTWGARCVWPCVPTHATVGTFSDQEKSADKKKPFTEGGGKEEEEGKKDEPERGTT